MILTTLTPAKFPLGQIVITTNAHENLSPEDIAEGLGRHSCGDWGNVCSEDAARNDQALIDDGRLLSAYGEGRGRFWIITEWDRSVTTILMPEDY